MGSRYSRSGHAAGIHVDPYPAAPGIDLDCGEARARLGQRAFPVVLVEDVRGLALQVEGPCMVVAAEFHRLAAGLVGAAAACPPAGGLDEGIHCDRP